MMNQRQTLGVIVGVLGLMVGLVGCGGSSGPPERGSIAEPDPDVEPKDCYVEPRQFTADSPEDVKKIANSPCTKVQWLDIADIEGLENLKAFSRIETVEDHVRVGRNKQLKSIAALSIEGEVGNIEVTGNPKLSSLEGLESISEVDTRVTISGNEGLDNLEGLGEFTIKTGGTNIPGLKISGNGLSNLEGVGNVTMEGGTFHLDKEDQLQNLEGLGELGWVQSVKITANGGLQSLEGLTLSRVEGGVRIARNPKLPTCLAEEFIEQIPEKGEDFASRTPNNGGYEYSDCNSGG